MEALASLAVHTSAAGPHQGEPPKHTGTPFCQKEAFANCFQLSSLAGDSRDAG